LLQRDVLYLSPARAEAAPYVSIAAELQRRGIPLIALDAGPPRDPAEFVNAGHLNDRGAQRYSALLGDALRRHWGTRAAAAAAVPAGSS
jgi:ABC-type sugar transport system substrate-binding protein